MIRSRDLDITAALQYPPFQGDETDVTPLSDKIVVAKKEHPRCQICEGPIQKGERHRALTERNNEGNKPPVMTFRFCGKCCRAMAHPDCWDRGQLIDSRYRIGGQRRDAVRQQPGCEWNPPA